MIQFLNGLALGSLFMIVSTGLVLLLGLRGVMNFAHGALYMAGAYIAYSIATKVGFWPALVLTPLCLAIAGVILEIAVFRPLNRRSPMEVALLTFGLALIVERVVVMVWGAQTLTVAPPAIASGTIVLFNHGYPAYRLVVLAVSLVTSALLLCWLRFSRIGLHIRATSHDALVSGMAGVNVERLSLTVVAVGLGCAGLAGALAAPYLSVQPDMDTSMMITALIVVIVSGLGSIGGMMVIAMALGIIEVVGNVAIPNISPLVPYGAMIVILVLRPAGLVGRRVD